MDIIESGKRGIDYDNYLRIQWAITNRCNYLCKYCSVYNQTENFTTPQYWIQIAEMINMLSDGMETDVRIFGGEPTIHPNFIEIIRSLESTYPILIWTNLSQSLDFLEKLISNKTFRFRCTFHPNYADLYEFMIKLQMLLDKGNEVFVNSMISPSYPEIGFECYDKIKKLKQYPNFNCSIDKIHYQDQDNDFFTFEHVERFNKEQNIHSDRGYYIKVKENNDIRTINIPYNKLIEDGLNNFYLYKCYTGPNSIYIDFNGDVYRCFTYKNSKQKPILNLIRDHFKDYTKFFNRPNICLLKECYCELDIKKEKL